MSKDPIKSIGASANTPSRRYPHMVMNDQGSNHNHQQSAKEDQDPTAHKAEFKIAQQFSKNALDLAKRYEKLNKAMELLEHFTQSITPPEAPSLLEETNENKDQLRFAFMETEKSRKTNGGEGLKSKNDQSPFSNELYSNHQKMMQNKKRITDEIIKAIQNANHHLKIRTLDERAALKIAAQLHKILTGRPLTLAAANQTFPLKSLDQKI